MASNDFELQSFYHNFPM